VNFIGHLHVARWIQTTPAFLLGAMLPDFASMGRVRLGIPADATVRAGLTFVHRRLRAHGVPYDYRNTEAVVSRLSRALSGRPRLAISPEDARRVAMVLPEIQRKVVTRLPALLAAVRAALLNEGVLAE